MNKFQDDNFRKQSARRDRKGKTDKLKQNVSFLIICEGHETEPTYFKNFRNPGVTIDIKKVNSNTQKLVTDVLKNISYSKNDFDQIWCVFDKDNFDPSDFNNAINTANINNIHVAYSNQCFELWYVLHFRELTVPVPRRNYERILDGHLKREYKKNDKNIFKDLRGYTPVAIKNAKSLLNNHIKINPSDQDPSTTVHLLVEQLLPYLQPIPKRK